MSSRILLLTLICIFPALQPAQAAFYQGARSLGMGGASVAATNDETSLFHNPAALGRLRAPIFTYLDPEVEVGLTTGRVATSDLSHTYTLEGLVGYLSQHEGMSYRGRAQISPSFVTPGFGLGMLMKRELSAQSLSESETLLSYREDWAPALGYAAEIWGGILKLGVTGRYVSRKEYKGVLPGTEPDLTVEALSQVGTGVGVDGGVLLTAPVALLPTLAFVARDLGTTTYSLGGGFFGGGERGQPEATDESWDVGFSLNPIHGNYTRSVWAFEYRGINRPLREGERTFERCHFGWEFNVHDQLFFRLGAHQRYWSAGFELATSWYQLQLASYGEEVGLEGLSKEDRRFVFKWSLRL